MDEPIIDGGRPKAERSLGAPYEHALHLAANWVSEEAAKNLCSVFEGTMSVEDFNKTLKPHESVFMEQIAAYHGVIIAKVPKL